MEQLKYIIEDSTIAELLGVQNFTNKEAAILELVKNAFDAKATELSIKFQNKFIVIKDDGDGMNAYDIKKHWMHIGKSDKGYDIIDSNNNVRVLAGSKGIGRFALSRLGAEVQLYSQNKNFSDKSVLWTTNWSQSLLKEDDPGDIKGTKIVIMQLRDKWNQSSVEKLSKYLSRTYNDNLMKIKIGFEESEAVDVLKYFAEPKLGYNCTSKINLYYSSQDKELKCTIESDEFLSDAQLYCEETNITMFDKTIDMMIELENDKELDLSNSELSNILVALGDFSAEFYFSIKESNTKDMDKFLYKHKILSQRYEPGVILYRNSFSISSYDGTKDWLGLGKRSRLSPAMATHPTGSWRVRENHMAGKIVIDKRENHLLEDLSNRQGLNENIYYNVFVKILDEGLVAFERYRQSIIRKINIKNKNNTEHDKMLTEMIIKDPKIIKNLSNDEISKFITEVKEFKKESTDIKKEIQTTEERYKYDVRILNVLATSGLKATSIAHEMHNDRNSVAGNCDAIILAMKKFDIWDFVNEREHTKYAYLNIPELINKNKRVNAKTVSFMDTMLAEVEKEQFLSENHNIKNLLKDIQEVWERDYAWIRIEIVSSESIQYTLPSDVLRVIFDNLILNSIQQNESKNNLSIIITAEISNGLIEFIYKDDGKGLNKKYIDNPIKILEVHETSRKRGHGLGMWIVNNTIAMSGGSVQNINGTAGFMMSFSVGGEI